ncbi:MAG: hypothetical protein HYX57_06515 [Chloroflexi bacterium]|nr:hypothetical protein [Chloroflexota bacterium]
MTDPREPDPLDALRVADPVDADRLSSASLARIRARVREQTMFDPSERPTTRPSRRRVGLWSGLIAAGAIAAVIALGGRGGVPGVTPRDSGGPVIGSCVDPYSTDALTRRGFAFDGTVAAINGDQVTFTVLAAWRGIDGGSVTLRAPGMTTAGTTSAGGPTLAVGSRYLVAGDEPFVWACGYTQPYDAAVAATWMAALGS